MKDSWFYLSSLVGVLISIATINHSYLVNSNINPFTIILYKFTITFLGSFLFLLYLVNNEKLKLKELYNFKLKDLLLLILSGLLSLVLIFISISALKNIPNSGYSVAIKTSVATILSVLFSYIIFNGKKMGHINKETILGVIMIVVGASLIKIYSK